MLSLVAALTLTIANAQQGFQFGVKSVLTSAWFLNEDDEGNAESDWGFGFGANYHFTDGGGVGLDFIWGKETQAIKLSGTELVHELSFFKVPLLFHFNSPSGDKVPFLGYVGFEYVKLNGAVLAFGGEDYDDLTFTDPSGNVIFSIPSEDLFRSTNFGVVLGLGPGWNITKSIQIHAIVRADYLFNDPEEKDGAFQKLYWGDSRPKTSLMTLGADFGLKILIGSGS